MSVRMSEEAGEFLAKSWRRLRKRRSKKRERGQPESSHGSRARWLPNPSSI